MEGKTKCSKFNYRKLNKNTLCSNWTMCCSNSGLKTQTEIHLYIYFKNVFSFCKFLQVHTSKKTKQQQKKLQVTEYKTQ